MTRALISFDYIQEKDKVNLKKIEQCFAFWPDSHKIRLDLDYYIQFYYDYSKPFPETNPEMLKKDETLFPFISELKNRMYGSFLFQNRLENILHSCERMKNLSEEEISWEKFYPPDKWRDFAKRNGP